MPFFKKDAREEFLSVYNKLSEAIFKHCYFRVFDRELAKDLMQEVFLRAWKYLSQGNEIRNFKAFLYKTANNIIIDQSKKKKNVSLDELREKGFDAQFKENYLDKLEVKNILKKLNKLDDKYKTVIIMRYIDHFSLKEISSLTEQSENTVSVRLYRGIKKLKELNL